MKVTRDLAIVVLGIIGLQKELWLCTFSVAGLRTLSLPSSSLVAKMGTQNILKARLVTP